jgi:hypothetical protein
VRPYQPLIGRQIAQTSRHRDCNATSMLGSLCMCLACDGRTALTRHRTYREPVWPTARAGQASFARCARYTNCVRFSIRSTYRIGHRDRRVHGTFCRARLEGSGRSIGPMSANEAMVAQGQPRRCLSSHFRSGSIPVGLCLREAGVGIVSVSPTAQNLKKPCAAEKVRTRDMFHLVKPGTLL